MFHSKVSGFTSESDLHFPTLPLQVCYLDPIADRFTLLKRALERRGSVCATHSRHVCSDSSRANKNSADLAAGRHLGHSSAAENQEVVLHSLHQRHVSDFRLQGERKTKCVSLPVYLSSPLTFKILPHLPGQTDQTLSKRFQTISTHAKPFTEFNYKMNCTENRADEYRIRQDV